MCNPILRAAVLDACRMALSAARKLESRPVDAATATLFRSVFGHDPWDPFPGTGNIASGDVACCQYRMVESVLRLGNVLYRCDPCIGTREDPSAGSHHRRSCDRDSGAELGAVVPELLEFIEVSKSRRTSPRDVPPAIPAVLQARRKERRQNSAYCFEVFALSVIGQTPEPISISRCQAVPIM